MSISLHKYGSVVLCRRNMYMTMYFVADGKTFVVIIKVIKRKVKKKQECASLN